MDDTCGDRWGMDDTCSDRCAVGLTLPVLLMSSMENGSNMGRRVRTHLSLGSLSFRHGKKNVNNLTSS